MKLFKHIPNTITSMNLLCGALGVIFTLQGALDVAFYLMLAAAVCDFFDGLSARLLKAYSPIGKELDSLCDAVSFGLAPSLILFNYLQQASVNPSWIIYLVLLIAPFSALRLAKFNLDTRQTTSFIGLPTPACALFVGSLIAFASEHSPALHMALLNSWTLPVVSIGLSLALVSEIPMFSLKFKSLRWAENKTLYTFALVLLPFIVAAIITHIHWSGITAFIFLFYILWNIILLPFKK
jgi:CDP-diacylglycerol--serine O-phosphatidyltransferase